MSFSFFLLLFFLTYLGETALQLALDSGNEDVVTLLKPLFEEEFGSDQVDICAFYFVSRVCVFFLEHYVLNNFYDSHYSFIMSLILCVFSH